MANYILAQYSIRSKQEYIFQTDKILEIVGASENISNSWNVLFDCANDLGLKIQKAEGDFNLKFIEEKMDAGELNLVELFCGGGNETVLFDNESTFIELNKLFTYELIKNSPGMIPMIVKTPVSGNYKQDYKKLMECAEKEKNYMYPGQEYFVLPFSMMEKSTFRPYTRIDSRGGELRRYSEETYSKYISGKEAQVKDQAIKFLNDMVTNKGTESLLAVIHADGNNMGYKIMDMLNGHEDYDYCIGKLREFTKETNNVFITEGLDAMKKKREELLENNPNMKESSLAYRVLIKDGDDITFICNARLAMQYVEAYLKAVQEYKSSWRYSSCAGICIFHSHYPFSKAYSLAEQACENSKIKVHTVNDGGSDELVEEAWIDFHYIHSGIGGDLEDIRCKQGTQSYMARPWCVSGKIDESRKIEKLYSVASIIQESGVVRGHVKNIGNATENSSEEGYKELKLLLSKNKELKSKLEQIYGDGYDLLRVIYDIAEVYDLWFIEKGAKG